jgi:hypothetical protein
MSLLVITIKWKSQHTFLTAAKHFSHTLCIQSAFRANPIGTRGLSSGVMQTGCKAGSRNKDEVNSVNWIKPKHPISKGHKFTADDAIRIKLSNRSSVLEADTLDVGQQSPALLKHNAKEQKSPSVKSANKKLQTLLLGSSHGKLVPFFKKIWAINMKLLTFYTKCHSCTCT